MGRWELIKCLLAQFYTKTFFGHNVPISDFISIAVMGKWIISNLLDDNIQFHIENRICIA